MLLLEGAGIALVGVLIGRWLPNRRRTPKPAPPPKPICGCGHHHAQHDPTTSRCHKRIPADKYDVSRVQCTCRQYSGPTPMPEFYAPEIGA